MKFEKTYVGVELMVDTEGNTRPVSILWEDGIRYEVDKLKHRVPAASLKVGGRGMRYTVVIGGLERYLFEENGRWFVERKRVN